MSTQLCRFSDGGYVLHKLGGNTSAWFDSAGRLLDAERRDKLGRMRGVRFASLAWDEIARAGRIYAPKG